MTKFSHEEIAKILADTRQRDSYIQNTADFLGIPVEELLKPVVISRGRKLHMRYENYKDRVSRAWQIISKGYYDGEGGW